MKPLFKGAEWTFDKLHRTWEVIDSIGKEVFGLDYYAPSLEVISAEQMLEAYSSVAMPIMYNHWSFGKSFVSNKKKYVKGQMGLAYEVVINTNPTLAYLMEDNTMTMQTLVMAHAVCGHGSFFKNNYLFKEWTDADYILDYLKYAKKYISLCEERYGAKDVEYLLDACHALQNYGVDKYKRPSKLKDELLANRIREWEEYSRKMFKELDTTVPGYVSKQRDELAGVINDLHRNRRNLPEENLLYFIEKNSPTLLSWEKEVVRIVRTISQYFYPQMQTQLMNEGWATFIHYQIMTEMYERGHITEGSYLEFLASHTAVVAQPPFDNAYYGGLNVYALGFAMMRDIQRICKNPTDEDRKWFPDIAGKDWLSVMKEIIENYRDESFVLQFLSPKVIRDFRLFTIRYRAESAIYDVTNVHSDDDVLEVRRILAKQYSLESKIPQLEIVNVDWDTDRSLYIEVTPQDGMHLKDAEAQKTLRHIEDLWGFDVVIDWKESEESKYEKVSKGD